MVIVYADVCVRIFYLLSIAPWKKGDRTGRISCTQVNGCCYCFCCVLDISLSARAEVVSKNVVKCIKSRMCTCNFCSHSLVEAKRFLYSSYTRFACYAGTAALYRRVDENEDER